MSDDRVAPIQPGIMPEFDKEREFNAWLAERVRNFSKEAGQPPDSVAVCLIGKRADDGRAHTIANTWTPDNCRSRFETSSIASMLLTKRALSDD